MIAELARSALDLLFPPRCRLCDDGISDGRVQFCANCVPLLDAERCVPACPRCAATVAPFEVAAGRCAECRDKDLRLDGTARVGEYYGSLGQLLRAYKFHNQEHLEAVLAAFLVEAVTRCDWFERVEAVVPVPTHWTRRVRRPMHPAQALAASVASMSRWPCAHVLRRVRAGARQIGLSYTDRLVNIRGAFAMTKGVSLHNARVLLIDDVRTTGATLDECAKVIRRGGASEVYAAVLVTVDGVGPGVSIFNSI